jgi:hypothetical protein
MSIEIFVNWKDITELQDRTFEILEAAGARRAIVMAQAALNVPRLRSRVHSFVERCKAQSIAVSLCTGPQILEYDAPLTIRDHLVSLCRETGSTPMLDAEPSGPLKAQKHWSAERLAPWLEVPDMQITTVRREAPRMGAHARITYAQLEGQTSTDTLDHALRIFEKYSPIDRVIPTLGSFDSTDDKRTLAEIQLDLDRCTDQARTCGRLAMFVAQTTSRAEAELLAAWAKRTW